MNKIAVVLILCLSSLAAMAETFSFNWARPSTLNPPHSAPTSSARYGDFLSNRTFTSGPVSLFINDEKVNESDQAARLYYALETLSVEMRAYANTVIVITVDDGYKIDKVTFEESVFRDIPLSYHGASGTFKGNTWTTNSDDIELQIPFTVDSRIQCTATHVSVSRTENAVDDIDADIALPEQWYTLSGIKLNARPDAPGIYIVRQGTKSTLRIVR